MQVYLLDAPKRLRKEVDTVLVLQEDIAAVEKVINDARSTLSNTEGGPGRETKKSLRELCTQQQQLLASVEKLYASLNIHEQFPELKGVDVEFVRTLLLARDLKINIRKRAVGSFLEWERLDQAVGGKHQALGMYLNIFIYHLVAYGILQEQNRTNVHGKPLLGENLPCFGLYIHSTGIVPSWQTYMIRCGPSHYRNPFRQI